MRISKNQPIGGMDVPRWSNVARTLTPPAARSLGKRAVRQYGARTASGRSTPYYHIIGAKKAGTTSLANWLAQHPGVLRLWPSYSKAKSARFFDTPRYAHREEWYRGHFPTARQASRMGERLGYAPVVGESSPYLLSHPQGALRLEKHTPDARLIALLRDPVERAFSHYRDQVALRHEPLPSFESALEAEAARLRDVSVRAFDEPRYHHHAHEHFSYIESGLYEKHLRRWFAHFPRDQILVIRFEDLREQPALVFDQVLRFLSLPTAAQDLEPRNQRPVSQPLASDTESQLRALFAPHNERLADLLGTDVWWPQ